MCVCQNRQEMKVCESMQNVSFYQKEFWESSISIENIGARGGNKMGRNFIWKEGCRWNWYWDSSPESSNNVESKYLLKTATHLKGNIFSSSTEGKLKIVSGLWKLDFMFLTWFWDPLYKKTRMMSRCSLQTLGWHTNYRFAMVVLYFSRNWT